MPSSPAGAPHAVRLKRRSLPKVTNRAACIAAWCIIGPAAAGVTAHFTANGTADDGIGGHAGSLQNGAGYDAGVEGQAFSLNGTQWVESPSSGDWQFGSQPFTIGIWVNFDVVHAGSDDNLPNVLVGCDDSGGSSNKWVLYANGTGSLGFHVNGSAFIFMQSPDPFIPTPGEWTHCAVTRLGNTYTFYANGQSLGSVVAAITMPSPAAPLTIGQAEGLGFVDGRIDDLQIYNEALCAAQIAWLHANPGSVIGGDCSADFNGDGLVDGDDLGSLLGEWGICRGCDADFNCDGTVDGDDLGTLLGLWGVCPA